MNKKEVTSAELMETYYSKCRKIKFEDGEIIINDFEDVYKYLFGQYGIMSPKPIDYPISQPTVYNKGGYQCDSGKYRSIDDFIKICKYYFPEKTVKNCLEFLISKFDYIQSQNVSINFGYCPNIRKWNIRGVYHYYLPYIHHIRDYNLQDIFPNLNLIVKKLF